MSEDRRRIVAQTTDIIDQIIIDLGDHKTINLIIQEMIRLEVDVLWEPQVPVLLARFAWPPIVRKRLKQLLPVGSSAMPLLPGLERVRNAPAHIVVPPDGVDLDDASSKERDEWTWVELANATVGELARHVDFLDQGIRRDQYRRDRLYLVLMTAREVGARDSDKLSDVLMTA